MIDHPPPISQRWQLTSPAHLSTEGICGLNKMNSLITTLAEHHGAFHPSRSPTDNEDRPIGIRRTCVQLGVPAASVLFSSRRILNTADMGQCLLAQNAEV